MVRWLISNLGTLILAFVLAIVVWVVATNEENPSVLQRFPEAVPIALVGKQDGLVITAPVPTQAVVTIQAPQDVWSTLSRDDIHLTADLSGLGPGQHEVDVRGAIDKKTAQAVSVSPASIRIRLEPLAGREIPIRVQVDGTPAVGYQAGQPALDPSRATISGPASSVDLVSELTVRVSVDGRKSGLDEVVALQAVDSDGEPINSVDVQPRSAHVTVPIEQLGGFKDVAVKVQWKGQVESGYRLTNISVSPPIVTVFSPQPASVDSLPGFVETLPVDLTGRRDDIDECVGLALPEDVSLVSGNCVTVLVGIAAIESSLTVQREVLVENLATGLQAAPAPPIVDVILSGPLPVLDSLKTEDVQVVLDLTGLRAGTYQLTPGIVLPQGVVASAVLPATIEVMITPAKATP